MSVSAAVTSARRPAPAGNTSEASGPAAEASAAQAPLMSFGTLLRAILGGGSAPDVKEDGKRATGAKSTIAAHAQGAAPSKVAVPAQGTATSKAAGTTHAVPGSKTDKKPGGATADAHAKTALAAALGSHDAAPPAAPSASAEASKQGAAESTTAKTKTSTRRRRETGAAGQPSLSAASAVTSSREVVAPGTASHHSVAATGATDKAAASASASGAGTVDDVRTPDRDPAHLNPQLWSKVQRVIARMAAQRGDKVEMVEGYRTPERQQYLYEQGRSRPGPVVTWTKNSLHSEGLAADLKIEGSGDKRADYAALQRIAKSEGLSTLGMKDPGHVELHLDGKAADRTASQVPGGVTSEQTSASTPSGVARVANIARVAQVARVARVATPGSVESTSATTSAAASTPAAPVPTRRPRKSTAPPTPSIGATGAASRSDGSGQAPAASAATPAAVQPHTFGAPVTQAAAPAGGVARVEQAMQVKDAFQSAAPSRISLRMDGTTGPVQRVRVALLDSALRGSVDVGDAHLATRLQANRGELLRTLTEKGFDPQAMSVRVAGTQRAADVTPTVHNAVWGALRPDPVAGTIGTMSGEGAGGQSNAHQRGSGGTGGWSDGRQQGAFNDRSRREQRRER